MTEIMIVSQSETAMFDSNFGSLRSSLRSVSFNFGLKWRRVVNQNGWCRVIVHAQLTLCSHWANRPVLFVRIG